jgi:hypothetical protein
MPQPPPPTPARQSLSLVQQSLIIFGDGPAWPASGVPSVRTLPLGRDRGSLRNKRTTRGLKRAMTNNVGEMSAGHMVGHTPRVMIAAAAMGALVLGGCGGGATKTVSVSGTFSPHTTTPRTTTSGTPSSSPKITTPSSTATSTGETGGVEATRTTTAPAFTKESTSVEGVGAAVAVVRAHGYSADETSTYNPANTLRVLVGTRGGSGVGDGQQAFFFVGGHYIGTDAKEPSASVKVVGQSDTEVALAYALYKPGDPLGHPSGGEATVHFQLNNGRLVALNPIPPATSATGVARN